MANGAEGGQDRNFAYSLIQELQHQVCPTEFRRRIRHTVAVVTGIVPVVNLYEVGALLAILQICCNRNADAEVIREFFVELKRCYPTVIYPLLTSIFEDTHVPVIERQAPLLQYILESSNKLKLRINGMKFGNTFRLHSFMWSGTESSSLKVFIKFGCWLDMSEEHRLATIKNILSDLIELCRDSGHWDAVTLERDLTLGPSFNPIELGRVYDLAKSFEMAVQEAEQPCVVSSARKLSQVAVHVGIPSGDVLSSFYSSLFPDKEYGTNNPGTLQHLCRTTIRKALQKNHQLPNGLRELTYPTRLKNYVSDVYED